MSKSEWSQDASVCLTEEQVREVKRIQKQLREGTMRFAREEEMDTLWKKCAVLWRKRHKNLSARGPR